MTSIAKRDDICGNKITRALQLLVKANIIQHDNFNQHTGQPSPQHTVKEYMSKFYES